MIDIKYVRENLDEVKKAIAKRHKDIDWDTLLKLDDEKRELQSNIETLRAKQNELSKSKERSDEAVKVKGMIKDLEPKLLDIEEKFKLAIVEVPNVPQDDVPDGADETGNQVVKTVGEIKRKTGKDHYELAKALDIIDIERATKVSGARFYYLKNEAVELEFALVRYILDIVKQEGFQPIIPPILIKEDMAWGSGHFEAINDDAYHTTQDSMVVVGTSEQSILPYYAGETIEETKRFVGFSTCLRREAGSYGKDVTGILRVHQFDKLEMFSFCAPENSKKEHDLIVSLEEKIMQGLGLPYQIVALCGGDMGLPSAKTVDIETWMPSQGKYRETHSSSNCTNFQSRRLKIRYRSTVNGQPSTDFAHTLNGTALAIARALIAIIENYQNDDGSIDVPEVLHKYLSFTKIEKK